MFVQVVVLVLVQLMELPHHRLDTVTLSIYKFKKNTCYQNMFFSMRRKQNITNQNVSLILIKTDNFIDSGMLIILTTSVQRFCNFTFITNVKGFKIYVCLIQRFWHLSIQSFPPPKLPTTRYIDSSLYWGVYPPFWGSLTLLFVTWVWPLSSWCFSWSVTNQPWRRTAIFSRSFLSQTKYINNICNTCSIIIIKRNRKKNTWTSHYNVRYMYIRLNASFIP